jgi:hypothetical protein
MMRASLFVANRVRRVAWNAAAFAFATNVVFAQTANIVGLGATMCKDVNREIHRNFHIQRDYFAWAQGFMSGILLRALPGTDERLELNPPQFSLQKQAEFLRSFCEKNPDKDYSDGVIELYRVLRGELKS